MARIVPPSRDNSLSPYPGQQEDERLAQAHLTQRSPPPTEPQELELPDLPPLSIILPPRSRTTLGRRTRAQTEDPEDRCVSMRAR